MTTEQTPQTPGLDPTLQGHQQEISLQREIESLRLNPAIACEDLYSSNKMQSGEYPDRPGVRVALETPIETAVTAHTDVEQDLMAVIALGQDVALGVVKGRDASGEEVNYVSLLNNELSDNSGRARFVDTLKPGSPLTIGRVQVEQVAGRQDVSPGVSGTHCTIELEDGVLTVVDETSTNGTSVFTNKTHDRAKQFAGIQTWSQPSVETKKLIESQKEVERLLKVQKLGRFTVEQ